MSKLTFSICALFTAILFLFLLCFGVLVAKIDKLENTVRMAQNDVVTLTTEVKTLQSAIDTLQAKIAATDESLESVEYFVYEDGSIQLVRENGDTISFCLTGAICENEVGQ